MQSFNRREWSSISESHTCEFRVANHTSSPPPSPAETTARSFEVKSNYCRSTPPRNPARECLHLSLWARACAHLSGLSVVNMTEEMGRKNELLNPAFIFLPSFFTAWKLSSDTQKSRRTCVWETLLHISCCWWSQELSFCLYPSIWQSRCVFVEAALVTWQIVCECMKCCVLVFI